MPPIQEQPTIIQDYHGLFNSNNSKNCPPDTFYQMQNFNFPDVELVGLDKVLAPNPVKTLSIAPVNTGSTFCTNATTVSNGSAWTGKDYIKSSSANYAYTFAGRFPSYSSDYLVGNTLGFSIPPNTTITGIQMTVKGGVYAPTGQMDVGLTIDSSTFEARKYDQFKSYGNTQTLSFGGPSDLWGVNWTTAQINSANFGGIFQAYGPVGTTCESWVYYFTITVYYMLTVNAQPIDGLYEYKYLNGNNSLQDEYIGVTGGTIYSHCLDASPVTLKTGLTAGACSFIVYNDKLIICNGKNYPNVYWGSLGTATPGPVTEMGAPAAVITAVTGAYVNTGDHAYKQTFITAGGEEVIGSVGNTVTIPATGGGSEVQLSLPLGYAGTITRNIYRTKAGGTTFYLLYSVPDNTTMSYLDDTPDASLSATTIPAINNELPKPYYCAVAGYRLYLAVDDKHPTQVFATDVGLEVIDSASFIDISNYGNDNTAVAGIGVDFSKIIVGTAKNMYILEPSDEVPGETTVKRTRGNVGILDGRTVVNVPAFNDFPGGVMFVSTLNDVRLLSGIQGYPIVMSIDNVHTENFAQDIRGTLNPALNGYTSISAYFFNYRYHLSVCSSSNGDVFVFDIRAKAWTYHNYQSFTSSQTLQQSYPIVLAQLGDYFYNGQPNGVIEQMYNTTQYKSQDLVAFLQSPDIAVSSSYKFIPRLKFWNMASGIGNVQISVTTDSNAAFTINTSFPCTAGDFSATDYITTDYETVFQEIDYNVININTACRWYSYRIQCNQGAFQLRNSETYAGILRTK